MSSYILTSPIDIYLSGSQSQIKLYNSAGTFSAQLVAPASLTSNIDFTFASVPELKLPFEPLKEELNMLRQPPFFFFEANAC